MTKKEKLKLALLHLNLTKQDIKKLMPMAKLSGNKSLANKLDLILLELSKPDKPPRSPFKDTQLTFDGEDWSLDSED